MDPHSIHQSDVPPTHQGTQAASEYPIFDSSEWNDIPTGVAMRIATIPIPINPGNAAQEIRASLKWEAVLKIKTKDVPRLMREGFHWTTANCQLESAYVTADIRIDKREQGWDCSRHYFLSDLGGDPYWTAMFTVFARDLQTLAQFRIDHLRPHMVYNAYARNANSRWVYHYSSLDPSNNFNAIYDDMPLEGWWPWPKEKGKQLLS